METVKIESVEVQLANPMTSFSSWGGQDEVSRQLQAAWYTSGEVGDLPMNPRLVGKPGVGKTTLACAVAQKMGLEVYLFQATMDTRPEDLIITPVIDEIADEYLNKATIGKLNVDHHPTIASEYGIRSIPCLLFFKDGKVQRQIMGSVPKNEIASELDKLL